MKRTRSAKSGQFVGKKDAAANPETTVVEVVKPSRRILIGRAAKAMYHETHPGSQWDGAPAQIRDYWTRLGTAAIDGCNLDLGKAEDDED